MTEAEPCPQTATGAAALPRARDPGTAVASALGINPTPSSAAQGTETVVVRRSTVREAASVIVHAETGVVTVRATQRQHKRIQEFIDRVVHSARRQVMIEATIVEVKLADGYEQGIDWSGLLGGGRFALAMNALRATNAVNNMTYTGDSVTSGIRLLETFGTTKVLSSPRLSVVNNQTAMLTVVNNVVYFNVKADVTAGNLNANPIIAYTTTPQTVSVGLVMAVTPQIGENRDVILNIRPTVTSVCRLRHRPQPQSHHGQQSGAPDPHAGDRVGHAHRQRRNRRPGRPHGRPHRLQRKQPGSPPRARCPCWAKPSPIATMPPPSRKLVIFLRPIVIRDASLAGDYAG